MESRPAGAQARATMKSRPAATEGEPMKEQAEQRASSRVSVGRGGDGWLGLEQRWRADKRASGAGGDRHQIGDDSETKI